MFLLHYPRRVSSARPVFGCVLRLFFLAVFAVWTFTALAEGAIPDPELEAYLQSVELRPAEGASASALSVTVAPLYRDAKWAFSSRWDDNLIDNLRVRDILNRRRVRGTFYLNASDNWYGNETRYPFTGDPARDLAKALLKGGHSIGAHSLSHNFLPALARPEIFYEILANRIDREVNSQSPVNSFVFPFTAFRNDLEGREIHEDIAALLLRAGFLHVANQYFNSTLPEPTPLLDSWLLPCDGKSVDKTVLELLDAQRQRERHPTLCACMHAWPAAWGGQALPKLDRMMQRWNRREIWWYANANELAAYRWQVLHGSLESEPGPGLLRLRLRRFEPWELGDAVPLTLVVAGAAGLTPTARLEGRPLEVVKGRRKGTWLVLVPHSPGHTLVEAYEWHRNGSNLAAGLIEKPKGPLPGLRSRLWRDDEGLHFRLVNDGPELGQLRLRWRLPLGWEPQAPLRLDRLKAGAPLAVDLPLLPQGPAFLRQGRFYAAVQLDARESGGRRIRLYSDVRDAAELRDISFPNGAFKVLGPLPGDRRDFDLPAFLARQQRLRRLEPCQTLFKDVRACWESPPPARSEVLSPELVPAGGVQAPRTFYTWDPALFYPWGHQLHYLLAADVECPVTRTVKAYYPRGAVRRLQVNGRRVGKNRRFTLYPGRNRILITYYSGVPDPDGQGNFNMLNYGPFFRIVGPDGRRLDDIRYRPPAELESPSP